MPNRTPTPTGWGGYRPGAGRKPLPPNQRRSERIVLRVTLDEERALKRAAKEAGEPHTVFARRVILDTVKRRTKRRGRKS